MDPTLAMGKGHQAVDFVRQLDRTAIKNCMEMALQRHEKELSVKMARNKQENDMLQESIEKGQKLTAAEK